MSTFTEQVMCNECQLPEAVRQCRSCGHMICRKCAALELSRFCHSEISEMQECGERLQLHDSQFRSYEEEEEDENGKHFITPTSEFSQDSPDVDSTNCSQEFNSLKSVNTSPWDSPSRPFDIGDNSPGSSKAANSDQEEQLGLRKPVAETEDSYYVYDNLSPYRSHVNQKAQQTLDFESNSRIWYPPPPEDENDDMEDGFFEYKIDDDDDAEGSSLDFSSSSIGGDAFPIREKPDDPQKDQLRNAVRRHFTALVSQLLKDGNVQVDGVSCSGSWLEIVSSLAWQAASFVKPDTRQGGSMDPSHYVKVKCVTSGSPSDSNLIKGVVCTKNVKHKRMVSQHKCPRLLLLGGALEYQRVSNKLASINTVMEEESDHLKMAVAKIVAHRPNVLLVEKSVSSYAQEYLLAKEISLVLNVKKSVLERISRCTGAQLVPSIDYISSAQLGQCEVFRVEKVVEECAVGAHPSKRNVKTLMYFEGCPRRLGCTVLLRGTYLEELKKVKHVVSLAIFAAYHLSLETSFLEDEGATLPKLPVKAPSSISENLINADAVLGNISFSDCPSICQPIIERHRNLSLCTKLDMQSLFPYSDASYLNDEILNFNSKKNNHSHSLNQKHGVDTSISYPGNSLDETKWTLIGSLYEEPSRHFPRHVGIHNGDDDKGRDKRRIATCKHLIAAEEHIGRDDLEVPEEYFSKADSQSILVSLSSTCAPKGTVCEHSQLFRIKFYGSFDKPLGRYLRNDLFDQTSSCNSCKEPSECHIRCYTHQQGSLTISVKRLTSMKLPGEQDGRIWMWHRCLKCEPKDGAPPATHRVVLSDAAWGLSFGKFLELSFSNHATANRLASCGHSLQKDCLRFYGFGNMVAFFRYSPVDILSVYLPPLVLDFTGHTIQEWLRSEAIMILSSLNSLHLEVFNVLQQIELKIAICDTAPIKTIIHKHILELKDLLQRDRNEYDVFLKPASADNIQPSEGVLDILELNRLKHRLLIDSVTWDRRLCLLDSFSKTKSSTAKVYPQAQEDFSHLSQTELRAEPVQDDGLGNSSEESTARLLTFSESWSTKQHEEFSMQFLECNTSNFVKMDLSIESFEGSAGASDLNLLSGQCYRGHVRQIGYDGSADALCSKSMMSSLSSLSDRIDLAWTGFSHSLTDQLTDSTCADLVGQASLLNSPNYRKLVSPMRVNSFDSAIRSQKKIYRGLSPLSLHLSSVKSFDSSGVFGSVASIPSTYQSFFQRSSSLKQLNFLSSHTPVFISSVSSVAGEGARLLVPQGGHSDVVIALYDNEPTSIISYAISSKEHANFINSKPDQYEVFSEDDMVNVGLARSSVSQVPSDNNQHRNYGSDQSKLRHGSDIADHKELHFKFSFEDEYSIRGDRVKFSVTCYFAKQFDALRKQCCPNELDFIRSLSRCKKWNAQGGKSNVYFAKSLDERFIIKQVTRTELDSFEDFAPEYFSYLMESINSGSPTCLAKVLGIYQVAVKHLKGGREAKMDLMVMENLLYGRNVSRVYDLKGSSRARYNPDASGTNKVLLDLNLLETLYTKPILLSSKAKRKLERAIWNDTSFLASIDVMDYSLLVGVDEGKKDLVIGIIDYMRQYTWDKHLETWVKASGILGGPKNASPTVVSPSQYKKRFRKAMSKYFLTVPDQWSP